MVSGRTGFYVAVTREGEVGAGDEIKVIARDANAVPVSEITRLYAAKRYGDADVASVWRALRVPALPESWKRGPAPVQTVRVFVGRLELVTPATERAVERALGTHDGAGLPQYGRFLEPILQAMMKKESNPERWRRMQEALSTYWSAEVVKNRGGN
jgi:hypothetical protein